MELQGTEGTGRACQALGRGSRGAGLAEALPGVGRQAWERAQLHCFLAV